MNLADEMESVLLELEDFNPGKLNYGGAAYPCLYAQGGFGTELVVGGNIETIQMSVYVRSSLFTGEVTFGDQTVTFGDSTITFGSLPVVPKQGTKTTDGVSKVYRVARVNKSPGFYRLDLVNPNR